MTNSLIVSLFLIGAAISELSSDPIEASNQLDLRVDYQRTPSGNSVKVIFFAIATNSTDSVMGVCGSFFLIGQYIPTEAVVERSRERLALRDSIGAHVCMSFEPFIVLPKFKVKGRGQIDCKVVQLDPGASIQDSLVFHYNPTRFQEEPGSIEMQASFVAGDDGGDWNEARSHAKVVKVMIPVP